MTSPAFNYFYRVELQVAQYTLGGIKSGTQSVREPITRTYNFVNKELRDAATASDRETYLPILNSVGELTLSAGEILPTVSFSSVELEDSRGSFGPDRRFSDILERFTIIGQPISFYVGESEVDTDAPASWTKIGSAIVSSWSKAVAGDRARLVIQVEPFKIPERVMNLEVSRDIYGMELAPDSALGKPLPIVFNKTNILAPTPSLANLKYYPQVQPIRISADGQATAKYALCTQIYNTTKARIHTTYLAKKTWQDSEDIWTAVSMTATPTSYLTPTTGSYYTLNTFAAKLYEIPAETASNDYNGFIVTGIEFSMKGQSTNPSRVSGAQLRAFIYQVELTGGMPEFVAELAQGVADLSVYDSLNNSGATFSVKISFDKPVVIDSPQFGYYDFWIGFSATNVAVNEMAMHKSTTTAPYAYKDNNPGTNDSYDMWKYTKTAENLPAFKLITATATSVVHENTYTRDGLTYSSMTITQPSADSGQVECDLDSLQLIALVEGFCKYSDNSRIYDLPGIINILSYTWNGETWSDSSAIDTTTLASSHYTPLFTANSGNHRARYMTGIIENKSTYSQVIAELARGGAAKVGILSNGKLFVYPWGVTASPAYVIPQADIAPLSWETRSQDSIINRTQLTFYKVYDLNISQEADKTGYRHSVDYSNALFTAVQQLTEQSRSLFGAKNIVENTFNVFGFADYYLTVGQSQYLTGDIVAGSNPAIYNTDFLAEYYLTRFALPFVYCSFIVPYHRYKDIKMFDVISFHHSEFPAFFGTDPNARDAVVDTGTTVTKVPNPNYGEELVRAQTYRGLVESVSYVMAMEHAPAIRLTVQVLINQEWDPT